MLQQFRQFVYERTGRKPADAELLKALGAAVARDWAPSRGYFLKTAGPHSFSSTQFDLEDADPHAATAVLDLADLIEDGDLVGDGREEQPHVTVLYGLHTQDSEDVRRLTEGFGPVRVRLGRTSVFPAAETDSQRGGDAYDVVKVDVASPDLTRLNALLASLPHTDTYPVYQPHVTLAYVKPGRGERYAGRDDVDELKLAFTTLVFSDQQGQRTKIDLTSSVGGGAGDMARPYSNLPRRSSGTCKPGQAHARTGCIPTAAAKGDVSTVRKDTRSRLANGPEGHWVTLDPSGTHVFLDEGGEVRAGPPGLTGHLVNNLPSRKKPSGGQSPQEPESKPENRLPPKAEPSPASRLADKPQPEPEATSANVVTEPPGRESTSATSNETVPFQAPSEPEQPQPAREEPSRAREPEQEPAGEPGRGAGGEAEGDRQEVAGQAEGPAAEGPGGLGTAGPEPAGEGPAGGIPGGVGTPEEAPVESPSTPRVPARVETVNKRLDRYEGLFRGKGNHKAADWLGMLRQHVGQVGVEAALEALGPETVGEGEQVQYGGYNLDGNADADFIGKYLDRAGISLTMGTVPTGERRAVSTVTPSSDVEGLHTRGDTRDVFPTLQTLRDKLEESQNLPGLEKSEDLSKLAGGEFGARVTNFTPDLVNKLDDTYGEGQWIVKSYGDEAYAGYGIFFPQRVQQLQQDARNAVWTAGEHLSQYGFRIGREPDTGKVFGLVHESGDIYQFGTPEYEQTIQGDARHWADSVLGDREIKDPSGNTVRIGSPASSELGASIPEGRFMAQPAFQVVGITNEERAAGMTFKKGGEGRVHIVTRNGKAEVVPHSTWLKLESLPVVFEDEGTRAMAQAAVDAINALPESERQGQLYAPDIVKTADGYRVVEANPANEAGASGYLQDNPFVIDSYVSHVTGREPAHVRFIRQLLSRRKRQKALAAARRLKILHKSLLGRRNKQLPAAGGLIVKGLGNSSGSGRWVTLEGGQHVFVEGGKLEPAGPGTKPVRENLPESNRPESGPIRSRSPVNRLPAGEQGRSPKGSGGGGGKKRGTHTGKLAAEEVSGKSTEELTQVLRSKAHKVSGGSHGMGKEELSEVDYEGKTIQWSEGNEGIAAATLAGLRDVKLPSRLAQASKKIVFTSQKNSRDAHWEETYGIKGFTSNATGGDGTVVKYLGQAMTGGTYAHESGHNLANEIWGTVTPPADSAYGKAQQMEGPVSKYGAVDPAEDFAEACMWYAGFTPDEPQGKGGLLHRILSHTEMYKLARRFMSRGQRPDAQAEFKKYFPKKHAALKELLGE